MEKGIATSELIDNYLHGGLSGEEREKFEQALSEDSLLREEVDLQRELNDLIIDQKLLQVKKSAQEFSNIQLKKEALKKYYFGSAAIVVMASAFIYMIVQRNDSPNPTLSVDTTEIIKNHILKEQRENVDTSRGIKENGNAGYHNRSSNVEEATIPELVDTTDNQLSPDFIAEESLEEDSIHLITVRKRNPIIMETVNPCSGIVINAAVRTLASCSDRASGSIIIDDVSGGTKPYQYSIEGDKNFSFENSFTKIGSGSYTVTVMDANGCISNLKNPCKVESRECVVTENFSMSPATGENWKIPVSGNSSAKLTIYDKGGAKVFETNIVNGYPNEWDGREMHGRNLEPGLYIYTLEFTNGRVMKGYITIAM